MGISDMLKEGAESAKELAGEVVEKTEGLVEKAGDAIERMRGDYLERATAMYKMVGEGKMLEAFDKYYHDDVVMQEATGETREGKAASRAFEEQFMASVKEIHGGGVHAVTSNEDAKVTMVEAWMDVTFQDGDRVKMEEVAVQRWQGDKIIHERFYYDAPS